MPTPDEQRLVEHRQRDATSLLILGTFFTILALLLMAGVAWTWDDSRAVLVNLACGCALLAVGLGMLYAARRFSQP